MKIKRVVADLEFNEVVIDFDDGTQMSVNPNNAGGMYLHFCGLGDNVVEAEQESANGVRINKVERRMSNSNPVFTITLAAYGRLMNRPDAVPIYVEAPTEEAARALLEHDLRESSSYYRKDDGSLLILKIEVDNSPE